MSRKRCGFNNNGETCIPGPLKVAFIITGHRLSGNSCLKPPAIERIDRDVFLSGKLVNRLTIRGNILAITAALRSGE